MGCEAMREVVPDITNICTTTSFYAIDHVADRRFGDLWLAPRCFTDTFIIAECAVSGASRDLKSIEDFVIRKAVAKAVLYDLDDFMVRSHPGTSFFVLLRRQWPA